MQELKIFESTEFGEVRTVELDGKPYFAGTDVARALGYVNVPDALRRHCRAIVKRDTPISGKIQEINYIPRGRCLPSDRQQQTSVGGEIRALGFR